MKHVVLPIALLSLACGSIAPEPPDGLDDQNDRQSRLVVTPESDGVARVDVDAHVEDVWVYFDLETGTQTGEDEAWDLAFMRFQIRTAVSAARVDSTFDELTFAPADGYRVDAEDSDDEGTDPDYAFLYPEPWYSYELATHRLTPYDVTYVVESTEGAFFKVGMVTYYDAAGSSGHPSFRFARLPTP